MSFSFVLIFLAFLGFGLFIMFCACMYRMCSRMRDAQIERDAQMCREQEAHMRSIYIIPFPRRVSQQDSDDLLCVEAPPLPQYNTTIYYEPPPPYDELGFKSDVVPPSYTESNSPENH